jgi:hypothetical protein
MGRRSALFWAVLAVVVLGAALYLPAYLASSATGRGEPVDFMSRPLDGWRFLWDAVRTVPGAEAGTPREARGVAVATFSDARAEPLRVELLWLPGRRLAVPEPGEDGQGSRDLTTNARLVWRVAGRIRPDGPIVTVGLIDLATGTVTYDARNDRSKLAQ